MEAEVKTPEDQGPRRDSIRVEGKGGKGRSVSEIEAEEQAGPTGPVVVSMSTPPEHQIPLFTPEQLHGFHTMYHQAPLLYPAFQTPMTVTRPPFLEHEERESLRRLRLEEAGEEERRGLEERARLERTEREEMSQQLRYLVMENRRLKDQAICGQWKATVTPKARTMPPAPSTGDPTPVTNQDEGPLVLPGKL